MFGEGQIKYSKVEARIQLRKEHDTKKSQAAVRREKEEKQLESVMLSRRELGEEEQETKKAHMSVLVAEED